MSLYPVFLKLKDTPCLVIGGGTVAERKVIGLLKSEARITIISPELTEQLKRTVIEYAIDYRKREYCTGDVHGYRLVIASTDSCEVNRQVYREAEQENIPINSVDDPDNSSFFLPAVIRRGDLQVAISTSGHVPYFAKKLRQYFEKKLYAEIELDLKDLARLRKTILDETVENKSQRKHRISTILGPKIEVILRKIETK